MLQAHPQRRKSHLILRAKEEMASEVGLAVQKREEGAEFRELLRVEW